MRESLAPPSATNQSMPLPVHDQVHLPQTFKFLNVHLTVELATEKVSTIAARRSS